VGTTQTVATFHTVATGHALATGEPLEPAAAVRRDTAATAVAALRQTQLQTVALARETIAGHRARATTAPVTAVASHCLLLTAQHRDPDDREEERQSKHNLPVHGNTLQRSNLVPTREKTRSSPSVLSSSPSDS
jgi:hypothetical protein